MELFDQLICSRQLVLLRVNYLDKLAQYHVHLFIK